MNTIVTTPDIHLYVTAVRERLSDLTDDEREELVGGLEADLSDLVAERGVEALPDPAEYAAELRVAAGFSAQAVERRRHGRRSALMSWLDRAGETWHGWVEADEHLGLPALAQSLRPLWWVLRALCATALLAEVFGSQSIFGLTLNRALLAAVLILISVQIGREVWFPGTVVRRSLSLRLGLVALNLFAIALLPVMFTRFFSAHDPYAYRYEQSSSQSPGDGLSFNGEPIANIYPYDAQGHLLTGVQLVDRQGRRLTVTQDPYNEGTGWGEFIHVPWLNGRTELYSVFPLPEQTLDTDTLAPVGDPRLQSPPFASLPPVTLAGVTPSVLVPATDAAAQGSAAKKAAQKTMKQPAKKQQRTRPTQPQG